MLKRREEKRVESGDEPLVAYLQEEGRMDGTAGDSVVIPNERSLYDS